MRFTLALLLPLFICHSFTLAEELAVPAKSMAIVVHSPSDYQVFQRTAKLKGHVLISGRVAVECDHLEFRITGKSLAGDLPDTAHTLRIDRLGGFHASIPTTPGGWYKLDLRAIQNKEAIATITIDHVGVGEVFLGAGQSNSTNYGEKKLKTETQRVASFNGSRWQLANDPQPGTFDGSTGGSFWPVFGDALVTKLGVPIGVAVTGAGATSINQWQPKGTRFDIRPTYFAFVKPAGENLYESEGQPFDSMMARIGQLGRGGFRAVLWHQGESDANQPQGRAMTSEEYAANLSRVMTTAKSRAGWEFPWFVAQVSYHTPKEPRSDLIREGQKMLWTQRLALEGPDTDALTGDHREANGQGVHLSEKGLREHGRLWAEKISAYLADLESRE